MSIQSDKVVHSYHPQARLSESQAMIEQLTLKLAQLEKAKAKASSDAADMAQQLDQVGG